MGKPKLGVVYDVGVAGVRDITASLSGDHDLVFIIPRAADPIGKALQSFGPVIPADLDDGIERAAQLGRHHGIEGLVTYSEHMLRLTAQLCEHMNLRGHDMATSMRLTNKKIQRDSLRAAGLPVPQNATVSRAEDWPEVVAAVGLPAIVKPLRGMSSSMTYRVESEKDVAKLEESLFGGGRKSSSEVDDGYIVEQLLIGRDTSQLGDYVSVECRTVAGLTTLYAITGTFPLAAPFREPGQFWPCQLSSSEQTEIFELAKSALSALGVTDGISHIEVKLTDDGPRIIEVNGRLGGFRSDLAARHCGLDLIREAADIALGVAPISYKGLSDSRSGATYSYSSLPPNDARELVSISGHSALLRAPGVEAYRRFYRNGSRLAADGSTDPLDVLFGHAPSLQEMLPLLRIQLASLEYTFRNESNYTIKALDLPAAAFIGRGPAQSNPADGEGKRSGN